MSLSRIAVAAAALATLAACAQGPAPTTEINDPWERSNREFHAFNKGLDTVLIRPTAWVYDAVTPALFRHLISNGLDTLDLPGTFVNNILQGDPEAALRTAGRFGINMLFGAGVLDPATQFGLPRERTDAGVTLAVWGFAEGPYFEAPIFGPGSTRDVFGRVAQVFLDPLDYIYDTGNVLGFATAGGNVIDARAGNLELIDRLLYDSEDSYITLRSAVMQMRRRQIAGGATAEALPDVFADD